MYIVFAAISLAALGLVLGFLLGAAARYLVANPVRAGLVARAGDYSHWDAIWV